MKSKVELTLPSENEMFKPETEEYFHVFDEEQYRITPITDLAILTGGETYKNDDGKDDGNLKEKIAIYCYTRTFNNGDNIISYLGRDLLAIDSRKWSGVIRPVLYCPELFEIEGMNDAKEIEYLKYPQYVLNMSAILRNLDQRVFNTLNWSKVIQKTGNNFTLTGNKHFGPWIGEQKEYITYDEYECFGKRFIMMKANPGYYRDFELSDGNIYHNDDTVIVGTSPIIWLVNAENQTIISKRGLVSGIPLFKDSYNENFSTMNMKKYLDEYMIHDLLQYDTLQQDIPDSEKVRILKYK